MNQVELLLEMRVLDFFLESARKESFNGILASQALKECEVPELSRDPIEILVESRRIDCIFARNDLNPYIKRLPELDVATQLDWMRQESLDSFCLYPTRSVLCEAVGSDDFRDKPFSRMMMLGEPQLSFVAFDLAVLGRYRDDPRFSVSFEDYSGRMSVTGTAFEDADFLERDKISVQSFGLGLDKDTLPYVIVFYRYLANLTAEHQQYWNSFRVDRKVTMCEPYFRASIIGDFWKNRSVRNAIAKEMELINAACQEIVGKSLFRQTLTPEFPVDLSAFLVPSTENFDKFVHSWDKLLSENINSGFFLGVIDLKAEQTLPDGRVVVTNKGSLTLLREWLELKSDQNMDLVKFIVDPLREVRRARQLPAHSFRKNEFSLDFHHQRRSMLWSIFGGLTILREFLAGFSEAREISVPTWLREEIDLI